MKTPFGAQVRAAENKAFTQKTDAAQILLFKENRSGNRMGKPGDANNIYFAEWFEFYTFGPDQKPRSEGSSLNFKHPDTHQPIPGGNGISEVDVIEAFRRSHPKLRVVLLNIPSFKGDLETNMNIALMKYREDGYALLTLPPIEPQAKQAGIIR